MVEVVDVIDVGPNFRREELAVKRRSFGSGCPVQPGPVSESEWLGFGRLGWRSLLRDVGCYGFLAEALALLHGRGGIVSIGVCLRFQLGFQFLDARTHLLKFKEYLCVVTICRRRCAGSRRGCCLSD